MNPLAHARETFDLEISGLRAVRRRLDASFTRAAEFVVQTLARNRKLVVVGVGKSGNIGRKIAATLTSTGSTSVLLDPVDALHGDLGIISDGDLVLLLSYSGTTQELVDLMPAIKRFPVKIITMTGAPRSILAHHSDLILNVQVPREACPFNLAPTTSTTAMLVMGDALAMTVLKLRGFRPQDFARHHPSGAIGRALLLKVKDIMRSEARNPVAKPTQTVKEALLLMTRSKAGCVSVINAQGRLIGVFTDGDFRRHMAADESVMKRPLKEVMTRRPISISGEALAMEALRIFNERNIDDLVVVDAQKRPVGLVDSQDLPKLKMM